MYDAVVEAVPMAQSGRNRKKAVVLISDGNDTNSRAEYARRPTRLCRETEVLVYAVGIDGEGEPTIETAATDDSADADSPPCSRPSWSPRPRCPEPPEPRSSRQ